MAIPVNFKGLGIIEYPDDWTEDQIREDAAKNSAEITRKLQDAMVARAIEETAADPQNQASGVMEGLGVAISNVGESAIQTVAKVPKAAGVMLETVYAGIPLVAPGTTMPPEVLEALAEKRRRMQGETPEQMRERIASNPMVLGGAAMEQAGKSDVLEAIPGSREGFWTGQAPQGVGTTVAGVGTALLTGAAGAGAVMFSAEAMDAWDEELARQAAAGERFNPDKAILKATGYGAFSAAVEHGLGVGRLTRKIQEVFGGTAKEAVEKAAKGGVLGKFLAGVAKDAAAGFTEEAIQRLGQDLIVHGEADIGAAIEEGAVGSVVQAGLGSVPNAIKAARAGRTAPDARLPRTAEAVAAMQEQAGDAGVINEPDPLTEADIADVQEGPITGTQEAVAAANAPTDTAVPPLPAATPGGTEQDPEPEAPSALQEQIQLTLDPESTKSAVLITTGTPVPDYDEGAGLMAVKTQHGTVIFNPEKIGPDEVAEAASGDVFDGRILGMADSGQTPVESPIAVTTSTQNARNVVTELVEPTAEAIAAATEAQQAAVPGGVTEVKPAVQIVAERREDRGEPAPEAPAVAPQAPQAPAPPVQAPAVAQDAPEAPKAPAVAPQQEIEADIAGALEVFKAEGKVSVSLLQRKKKLGYARAQAIVDKMQRRGMVTPANGAQPRALISDPAQPADPQAAPADVVAPAPGGLVEPPVSPPQPEPINESQDQPGARRVPSGTVQSGEGGTSPEGGISQPVRPGAAPEAAEEPETEPGQRTGVEGVRGERSKPGDDNAVTETEAAAAPQPKSEVAGENQSTGGVSSELAGDRAGPGGAVEEGRDAGRASPRGGDVVDGGGGDGATRRDDAPQPTGVGGNVRSDAVPARNYRITEGDQIGEGGLRAKFRANIEAIKTLKQIEAENRNATREEQARMVKFTGWGAMGGAFGQAEGWAKEAAELQKVLTEEEYATARRSTLDAFYTSPTVIRAIHGILRRLGFRGGRMVEGGMGVGHFLGLMPDDWAGNTTFTGVERDSLTARIAALLYPKARVLETGLEKAELARDSYDASAGNPPFGNVRVFDPAFPEESAFTIHNYFIAKQISLLRPGGVGAWVVSHYFLDALDPAARKWIEERAEFLGAVRLPSNAFKDNAGTEVTTDIVVFRRRDPSDKGPSVHSWMNVNRIPFADGKVMKLNEYFVGNPTMMLGKPAMSGKLHSGGKDEGQFTLEPFAGKRLDDQLAAATESFPEDVYAQEVAAKTERLTHFDDTAVPTDVPVGSFFVAKDGTVMVRGKNQDARPTAEAFTLPPKYRPERLRGLIKVRDALRRLVALERDRGSSDASIQSARQDLNREYDGFVREFGILNRLGNRRVFSDDPLAPRVYALERDIDFGISRDKAKEQGVKPRDPTAKKADIFSRRMFVTPAEITSAPDSVAGLGVSLNQRGSVDIPYIAGLTGIPETKVVDDLKGLIYRNPEGGWETAQVYLSGNVREKLAAAKKAVEDGNSEFRENVEALEKAQPKDVPPSSIEVPFGADWVGEETMSEFLQNLTGFEPQRVLYNTALGRWAIKLGRWDEAVEARWGVPGMKLESIVDRMLNGVDVVVSHRNEDGSSTIDVDQTARAQANAEEIRSKWADWVMKDPDRRAKLAKVYNERFNAMVVPVHDGSHLTLPGKNPGITLLPNQLRAAWRAIVSRVELLDHVVGAGKTFAGIAAMMEMKRLGIVRKPLFVVPNHLTTQWRDDFIRLYPAANVLWASKTDFAGPKRRKLFARIMNDEWDAVIIGHSSLVKLGMSPEFEAKIFQQTVDELVAEIRKAKSESGKASEDARFIKDMEKRKQNLEAKIQKLMNRSGERDRLATFDELGIDGMFIDEVHEFKNAPFVTAQRPPPRGLGSPEGSDKAFDLYIKIQWLQETFGNRAPLLLATGTPISNSLLEMFHMLRYLMTPTLRKMGINTADAFMRTFGDTGITQVSDVSGTSIKFVKRFKAFINAPELSALYRTVADTLTSADLQSQHQVQHGRRFPTPKIKGGGPRPVAADQSDAQAEYMGIEDEDGRYNEGSILYRFANFPDDPSIDNPLAATTDARKAALDIRLVRPNEPDFPGSKVNRAADEITRIYNENTYRKGTQLVFCDLSVPASARGKIASQAKAQTVELADETAAPPTDEEGADTAEEVAKTVTEDEAAASESKFSVYDDMKAKLVARGIPADQIAFIHDFDKPEQKAELFRRVNAGEVRILMGSTPKLGAGTNVQKKLVALHHLDAPWRPSDLEQREGRIIRQGNEFYDPENPDAFQVEILRYVTRPSFDVFMWDTIAIKAGGIERFRNADPTQRRIEEVASEAATAAQMKAAASGNPLIIEEITLRTEIDQAERRARAYRQRRIDLEDQVHKGEVVYPELAKSHAKKAQAYESFAAEHPRDPFRISIGGKAFRERDTAREALSKVMRDNPVVEDRQVVASFEYRGTTSNIVSAFQLDTSAKRVLVLKQMVTRPGSDFPVTIGRWDTTQESPSFSGMLTRLDNMIDDAAADETRQAEFYRVSSEKLVKDAKAALAELPSVETDIAAKRARYRQVVAEIEEAKKSKKAPRGTELQSATEPGAPLSEDEQTAVARVQRIVGELGIDADVVWEPGWVTYDADGNAVPIAAVSPTEGRPMQINAAVAGKLSKARIRAIADHEAVHPELSSAWGVAQLGLFELTDEERAWLRRRGYTRGANESEADYEVRLKDEWVAHQAERDTPWWRRMLDTVRGYLAKVGLAKLSNDEVARRIIRDINRRRRDRAADLLPRPTGPRYATLPDPDAPDSPRTPPRGSVAQAGKSPPRKEPSRSLPMSDQGAPIQPGGRRSASKADLGSPAYIRQKERERQIFAEGFIARFGTLREALGATAEIEDSAYRAVVVGEIAARAADDMTNPQKPGAMDPFDAQRITERATKELQALKTDTAQGMQAQQQVNARLQPFRGLLAYLELIRGAQERKLGKRFPSVVSENIRSWLRESGRRAVEEVARKMRNKDTVISMQVRKIARDRDIPWTALFQSSWRTQREVQQGMFRALRAHPDLATLSRAEVLELTNLFIAAWAREHDRVFKAEFRRAVGEGAEVAPGDMEKMVKALPRIVKWANLGLLDDSHFRDAVAPEYGLAAVDEAAATRLGVLAQQAQAAPEGVIRNRVYQQMVDELVEAQGIATSDLLRDFWFANILSGLRTWIDVGVGSWLAAFTMTARAAADLTLRGRPVLAYRTGANLIRATWEGIANAADIIATGDLSRLPDTTARLQAILDGKRRGDSLEGARRSKNLVVRSVGQLAYVRRIMTALDYVGALGARDAMVIYAAASREDLDSLAGAMKRFDSKATAEALAQAKAELGPKAKWVDVKARQREILEAEISAEVKEGATTLGKVAALNADPVGFGGIIYRAIAHFPWIIRAPAGLSFARAAINLAQNASDWLPGAGLANWGRAKFAASQMFADLPDRHPLRLFGLDVPPERRRLILGAQVAGLGLTLAAIGLFLDGDDDDELEISGSWYGVDPKRKGQLMSQGERPLSIRIGNTWVSYRNTPFAAALAFVGNLRDKMRFRGEAFDEEDTLERALNAWLLGAIYIKDASAMSQFAEVLGAAAYDTKDELQSANKRLASTIGNTVSGFIPGVSLLREIDTITDPEVRRPSGGWEAWIRNLPFARREIGHGPAVNALGDPIEAARTPVSRWLTDRPDDPEWEIAARLASRGVWIPVPGKTAQIVGNDGAKRKMTGEEYYQYQVEAGKLWRQAIADDADFLRDADRALAKGWFEDRVPKIHKQARELIRPTE
ncbi:MAG: DEAD/DEAH box helicase family protein [Verrucomicrobiales bacterium]|nr:DEAD/DEAH box helicase family protein [Verrucomicrobiales bacterium]